jgi:hypothetical protein
MLWVIAVWSYAAGAWTAIGAMLLGRAFGRRR